VCFSASEVTTLRRYTILFTIIIIIIIIIITHSDTVRSGSNGGKNQQKSRSHVWLEVVSPGFCEWVVAGTLRARDAARLMCSDSLVPTSMQSSCDDEALAPVSDVSLSAQSTCSARLNADARLQTFRYPIATTSKPLLCSRTWMANLFA